MADRYTAHKIRRESDHLLIEVPGELGPLERKLIKHYRRAGPHLWVIVFRGGTPDPTWHDPPGEWGDDTW